MRPKRCRLPLAGPVAVIFKVAAMMAFFAGAITIDDASIATTAVVGFLVIWIEVLMRQHKADMRAEQERHRQEMAITMQAMEELCAEAAAGRSNVSGSHLAAVLPAKRSAAG